MSSTLGTLLLAALPLLAAAASPANLTFTDCFDASGNVSRKIDVSNVYAQVLHDEQLDSYLDLVLIANSPLDIIGRAEQSPNLATLFTSTSILTLSAWSNSSYLCDQIRPPDASLSTNDTDGDAYCPIAAGPFALSAQIPWGSNRPLTTLTTRLRAVDTYSNELLCVDMITTPLDPHSDNVPYGDAEFVFWGTVALAIAYWLVVGVARIVSAWNRGISRPGKGLWERVQSAGFILASAMSGERFASSPALLRFCTPSMRDVIFHTQWCSALAMIAVEWPQFIYPLLTQTSWATLSYNISVTPGAEEHHWNPLYTPDFDTPSDFSTQINDKTSALYLDPSVTNTIFTLPRNATNGMTNFAYSVGVRPQDLFGICLVVFLGIVAAAIALSTLIWLIDRIASFIGGLFGGQSHNGPGMTRLGGARTSAFGSKDLLDSSAIAGATADENKSLNGKDSMLPMIRPSSKFTLSGSTERGITSTRKPWWRFRSSISSFHGSILHGNLVRVLILFHLPITIFSVYQMTLSRDIASLASVVLAGLSFAIISVIIPTFLVLRVRLTTTSKLYDETRTLLGLGPLYNHYRHGSQMFAGLFFATNVAFGLTIGAGQKSGTAQAIVILVVEVLSALITSIWLPWGIGASMGLISFLFCVARIVIAVLLLILTPAISIGTGAGGWVAYGVLIILALVYLALLLMLIVKLVEALVRILGFAGFDQSKHVVDAGLFGACGLAGCCGGSKRRRRPRTDAKRAHKGKDSVNSRYQSTQPGNRDSVASSFLGSPVRPGTGKGSMNSGPPPSVLKPEHALRPYKEESDDENGYIMGAWQPFQTKTGKGYVPVEASPTSTKPAGSGFSRVGGGRAHIDTPYAIKAGSTQTFPSIGQQAYNASAGSLRRVDADDTDTLSLSAMSAARQQEHQRDDSLPPGAMPPFHVRTKSQTAIIEHTGASAGPSSFAGASASRFGKQDPTPPPSAYNHGTPDDDGSDADAPKKKPWYHLRRNRPHSGGDASSSYPNKVSEDPIPEPATTPTPGRSFVVVRKPQQLPARTQKLSTASAPGLSSSPSSPGPSRQSYPSAYPPTSDNV